MKTAVICCLAGARIVVSPPLQTFRHRDTGSASEPSLAPMMVASHMQRVVKVKRCRARAGAVTLYEWQVLAPRRIAIRQRLRSKKATLSQSDRSEDSNVSAGGGHGPCVVVCCWIEKERGGLVSLECAAERRSGIARLLCECDALRESHHRTAGPGCLPSS